MYFSRYIVQCYRYAKLFVPASPHKGSSYYGFSHQWDTEVVEWQDAPKTMKPLTKECDTFLFFEPHNEILSQLPKNATTAFVFDPRDKASERWQFAEQCSWLLIPCREWMEKYDLPKLFPNTKLAVWPYDPYVQFIPQPKIDFEIAPRVFFPTFGFSLLEKQFVEQVVSILRECKPNIKTVIGRYDANEEPRFGIDPHVFDWRLLKYLQNSDWIVDLNTRPTYGLFAAFAGGYGLQWSGFDIAPNTDYYAKARRHLIHAEERESRIPNGPRVIPDLASVAEQLARQLSTTFHGDLDRDAGSGSWEQRRAEFLRVTNLMFGIKSRF